ncbi:MAG: hypothetical protein ACI3YX_04055, partial [Prevotella sp.]
SFKKLKVAFRPRKRHLYDANHGIYGRQMPAGPVRAAMNGLQKERVASFTGSNPQRNIHV